jgi:ribosomal protein S18 acetylase RimI-like enzyme
VHAIEGIPLTVDLDVQNHVRALALASPDHLRVGPFVFRYNPDWPSPYANYAIPDHAAVPSTADVQALVRAFRERDRKPRLEYLPSCAPRVEPALLSAGFAVENRAPVMACAEGELVRPEPVAGFGVREPCDEAGFVRAARVQHTAYGEPGDPASGEVDWLRRAATNGGVVAVAELGDGTAVAAGACSVPAEGLSELAGLAVAADFRRRGIGAAVAAHLTAEALRRGCRAVWLEPGDADIARIYRRIGYRVVGEKLNISLP